MSRFAQSESVTRWLEQGEAARPHREWVAEWFEFGLREFGAYLAQHAAFAEWLGEQEQ